MHTWQIGNLDIGNTPRVVGTISTGCQLKSISHDDCDIVEVRLDQVGHKKKDWLKDCRAIESAGTPVILTLRLESEGGGWTGQDKDRSPILAAAIEKLATIDIEMVSDLRDDLCGQAEALGKPLIVSYHNFEQTPPLGKLKDVLNTILEIPNAVPKISTMVKSDTDIDTLTRLLQARTAKSRPICVIGMGSVGTMTRVLFPSLGSCLTYGYLDSPSAPGQLPSALLIEHMRGLLPDYNEERIIRKELMEYV